MSRPSSTYPRSHHLEMSHSEYNEYISNNIDDIRTNWYRLDFSESGFDEMIIARNEIIDNLEKLNLSLFDIFVFETVIHFRKIEDTLEVCDFLKPHEFNFGLFFPEIGMTMT